ncbi:PGF-pre-PGF domain-containing protein [Natrialbaceae archaeon A-arb3/5]
MKTEPLPVVAVTVLLVLSGIGGFAQVGGGTTGASAAASAQAADTYVVEQGEFCQPIEPLSTDGTVESFYDYRNHETHPDTDSEDRQYSSYGTTHLQEDDTSLLFLHEGTDGMSLVMIHDQVHGDTEGGVVTFDLVGLPDESEWVVQDDLYDGPSNMAEWDEGDGWASASWIWRDARTDGGAIQGGLNDEFAVTIQPAFNEDAALYGDEDLHDPDFYEDGEIIDWQVLSGDSDEPDRTEIPSLDEDVTIRTGTCDGPSVSYDRTDDGVTASVTDAAPDDHVSLEPAVGSNDSVRYVQVAITDLDGDASYAFGTDQPGGPADSPSGGEALSHLSVDGEPTDVSGTVAFSIDAELLDEHDLDPEHVALYEADGSDWNETETNVTGDSGGAYQFEASVSSMDGFAVAPQEAEPREEGITALPAPGFEAGLAIGAIVLVALLWANRRRT